MNFEQHETTRAWLMWGVLTLAFIIVFLHRVSPGVILDCLMTDLNIQEAAVAGTLAGMYSIIYCLMQIPSGLLADFWGPRKTVTTGMLVAGLGSFIFALAPNLFYAFMGRGIVGLGVSVVLVSILKFLTLWFKQSQFTMMTGLTMLLGNGGSVLGTFPLALLVQGMGWRKSHLVIGAVTLFIAAICWFIVLDRPRMLEADSRNTVQKKHNNNKRRGLDWLAFFTALKIVLKNPHNAPLFCAFFGIYGTLLAFTGAWGAFYLMHVYGFTRQESARYLLVLTVGISLGYFFIGYISDKILKRKWPGLISFAVYILIWAILISWRGGKPPEYALYPLFFVMGLTGTGNVPLFASAKELNEPAYSGLAVGVVNVGAFAGAAILQPLWGYILDWKRNSMGIMEANFYPLEAYRFLFIICLGFLIFCFCISLYIKETKGCNVFIKN